MKEHIVGVKIDSKSPNSARKTYYYKTDKDLKRGEVIRGKVPSGGTPKMTVAIQNSSKKVNNVKELKEEK